MSIKKCVNGSFVNDYYREYGTETDTITTLPKSIIADGQSASANIIGNMVQTGTPSPSSIIMPDECGDKTANLFNDFDIVGQVPSVTNGNLVNYIDGACTNLIELSSGLLTLSIYEVMVVYVFLYDANESLLGWVNLSSTGTRTTQQITNYEDAKYARVRTDKYSTYLNEKKIMLNTGSTALPYEPWGYKIPISSGGVTTPVYLGEVQSERQIKKLVLTGTEYCKFEIGTMYTIPVDMPQTSYSNYICSHYQPAYSYDSCKNTNNTFAISKRPVLFISDNRFSTATELKTWLAQQYSAGTPVTVWYVLATPQTTTLNEPIRKIGNYADSVSVTGIPTTGTAESFDIDTTLKPSEVDLTYHGWHEHSDTKFTG